MGLLDGTAEVIGLAEEAILAGESCVLGFQRRVKVDLCVWKVSPGRWARSQGVN
jgi:hypothetical protein